MNPLTFRTAHVQDIAAIVKLVNSAYRGEGSKQGWTTEADLIDGTRTDEDQLRSLISERFSLVELCERAEELVGCVHIQKLDPDTCYLGMLTVRPDIQAGGIGKELLTHAESIAQGKWNCLQMRISVIDRRTELLEYYERRGYRRTGHWEPFHKEHPSFGQARVEGLKLLYLVKKL